MAVAVAAAEQSKLVRYFTVKVKVKISPGFTVVEDKLGLND